MLSHLLFWACNANNKLHNLNFIDLFTGEKGFPGRPGLPGLPGTPGTKGLMGNMGLPGRKAISFVCYSRPVTGVQAYNHRTQEHFTFWQDFYLLLSPF